MISFDVISVFTTIPVDKTCRYIRTKLENDPTQVIEEQATRDATSPPKVCKRFVDDHFCLTRMLRSNICQSLWLFECGVSVGS
jgi:hypothetical protein